LNNDKNIKCSGPHKL